MDYEFRVDIKVDIIVILIMILGLAYVCNILLDRIKVLETKVQIMETTKQSTSIQKKGELRV